MYLLFFSSIIPHDFGRNRPVVIKTQENLKAVRHPDHKESFIQFYFAL